MAVILTLLFWFPNIIPTARMEREFLPHLKYIVAEVKKKYYWKM
jgi:hypothetical protein